MNVRIFETIPGIRAVIIPDKPLFTIAAVSNDFVKVSGRKREDIVGRPLLQAFPQQVHAAETSGSGSLQTVFDEVSSNHQPCQVFGYRYDVQISDGSYIEKYWNLQCLPVINEQGQILHLLLTAEDCTAQVLASKKEERLKDVEKAFDLFMQAPVAVCILSINNYVVELANEQMLHILGRTSGMIGKPIEQSLTEARLQGLLAVFDKVKQTGQTYHVHKFPASIFISGERVQRYFDVVFQPYYPSSRQAGPSGIFCVAYDITELVNANKKIEQVQQQTERQKRVYEAITRSTPILSMYLI